MLTNTETQLLVDYYAREAIKNNMIYRFKFIENNNKNKQKIQGAYNYTDINNEAFKNIFIADFTSSYPNIIISFNISPETFVKFTPTDEISKDKIIESEDDNFINCYVEDNNLDIKGIITFRKERGLIPEKLSYFLAEKNKISAIKDSGLWKLTTEEVHTYNKTKLILNSTYGCLCQSNGWIYNKYCAALVTYSSWFGLIKL